MEWINVKDRLPITTVISTGEKTADFNWVPVTDGNGCWTIARYGCRKENDLWIDSWEFWDTNDTAVGCPYSGDSFSAIGIESIAFWGDIWETLPETNNEPK